MEQFNNDLPVTEEDNQIATVNSKEVNKNSALLNTVRQKFNIFGGISIIFGGAFAACFYKAAIGINYFLFVLGMITLLCVINKVLKRTTKKATIACYMGASLLGLSTFLTANETVQFLNTLGILLLLDIAILHQFYEDGKWDFLKHLGRMFGLLFQGIACVGMPIIDSFYFLRSTRLLKKEKTRNIIIGLGIALPLLGIVIFLLSSADLLFNEITGKMFEYLFSPHILGVSVMVLLGFIACYCIICGTVRRADEVESDKYKKKLEPAIAITTMTCLFIVYVVFCGIQVIYLFNEGLFVLPQEFTFAEYARRGFFELLFVTGLNIVLILISSLLFKENKILRIILTGMTVCTYIMIASATYRMLLYIGTYQLTFLRLFVLLFLLIDALVLAGVIASVFHCKFPLFGYCVVVVSVCYILFSFGKPDYFIASYNVRNQEILDYGDYLYLTTDLSADAAPIVLPLLSDVNSWKDEIPESVNWYTNEHKLWEIVQNDRENYSNRIIRQENERSIREFNLSYYFASRQLK